MTDIEAMQQALDHELSMYVRGNIIVKPRPVSAHSMRRQSWGPYTPPDFKSVATALSRFLKGASDGGKIVIFWPMSCAVKEPFKDKTFHIPFYLYKGCLEFACMITTRESGRG